MDFFLAGAEIISTQPRGFSTQPRGFGQVVLVTP
jgi:hypothetical protein